MAGACAELRGAGLSLPREVRGEGSARRRRLGELGWPGSGEWGRAATQCRGLVEFGVEEAGE